MFVRAEAYWKAGALDQDFFAHQEEIDLCWRIKNMGCE
jgi:GT2 family glycosyltransferase